MQTLDFPIEGKRVFVAGHRGMVGAAVVRALEQRQCHILTAPWPGVDLRRHDQFERWMAAEAPDAVIVAAARVGGILANDTRPAEFIHDNVAIATAVVDCAHRAGVSKLLFLGSSCIYPREARQPISETALLTGPLEPTNEWYAVAKIAGIKLCQAYRRQYGCNFIAAMPCNLYGPGDNYDLASSHVVPALMRKMHEAKTSGAETVGVWGSGTPQREFLHVDDLADAVVYLLERYADEQHINVGVGSDIPIAELARLLQQVTGFQGRLAFDPSKPDGTPRKVLDTTKLTALGWQPRIALRDGLEDAYRWFLSHAGDAVHGRRVGDKDSEAGNEPDITKER